VDNSINFTIENPMPPLWMMFPHIHLLSIGWRMGYGESYKFDFFDWLDTLSVGDMEKYKAMFPPPVLLWKNWYEQSGNLEAKEDSKPWGIV